MVNALVVEDLETIESTVQNLRRQGYQARGVGTGSDALRHLPQADIVLLDLELPDMDGLEVCRAIRAAGDTPVIAFSRQDAELDRVLALQAGADDCVVKTCGSREVMARMGAVLRRVNPQTADAPQSISLRPLHIDGRSREVRLDGRPVDMTSKEFELLYVLASTPERVVSRKELMAKVWESDRAASSRTIDTHVSSLRAKLGSSKWIVTVRGVGYKIGTARRHPVGV
ncbi:MULTISPECIES: response regulator transcription factor [unclassified Streptomyces]|uniref:response regulator transcription factor n=1 Tax=unclassified Streptomyces TaxID=2593676 RepID=UPI0006B05F44|nr:MULTISPECIES: response regulator transcription factor [unclassified Streptomyces]KOX37803.1 transcriptional regulator [Streptomyces sp. NRRL F-6491]KOX52291.1 transcriptional regulator [Streptomyces sp. NRRL F-6492]